MPAPPQLVPKKTAKAAGKASPAGQQGKGANQGGALQAKLQKANYREGRDLVKPGQGGQPSVMSAGPKAKAGGQGQLNPATRGMEQTTQTTQTAAEGDPFHSQLFNQLAKGSTEGKTQLAKADNMHAATLTGVNTPASRNRRFDRSLSIASALARWPLPVYGTRVRSSSA